MPLKLVMDLPTKSYGLKGVFDIISQNNWKDTLVGKYDMTDISKELISGLGLKDRAQGKEKKTEESEGRSHLWMC